MASLQVVPTRKGDVAKKLVFKNEDFSGQDLRGRDMRNSSYLHCNFDKANMSEVNCEGTDFTGSTFRGTNLYRANWKDCRLSSIVFEPRDAYGITFSFTCQTFQNVQVSQLWLYSWLLMAAGMWPTEGPVKEDIKGKIIALIGAERYVKLKNLFSRRDF